MTVTGSLACLLGTNSTTNQEAPLKQALKGMGLSSGVAGGCHLWPPVDFRACVSNPAAPPSCRPTLEVQCGRLLRMHLQNIPPPSDFYFTQLPPAYLVLSTARTPNFFFTLTTHLLPLVLPNLFSYVFRPDHPTQT